MAEHTLTRIVALGFSAKDLDRLIGKCAERELPVDIIDGQCFGQGSNCVKRALARLCTAQVALWRPKRMRHLPSGCLDGMVVLRVNGVSSAVNAIEELLNEGGRLREAC